MTTQSYTHDRRSALVALGSAALLPMAVAAACPAFASIRQSGAWETALAEWQAAERAQEDYERDFLNPISSAHAAVRSRYPMHYDFTADPEAQGSLDAIKYEAIQQRFDELVNDQGEALQRLVQTPAPNAAALAIKLRAIHKHDAMELNEKTTSEMLGALIADAERLPAREA